MLETLATAPAITFEGFMHLHMDASAEWREGKVIPMAPVTEEHNDKVFFVATLLRLYTESTGEGVVKQENFVMKLPTLDVARSPDVLVVTTTNLDHLKPTYLDGPADLVVELVSMESTARDYGEKMQEYEQAGVQEYWIIDPIRRKVSFYVRGADGVFHDHAPTDGVYQSMVLPRLRFPIDLLFQTPSPTIRATVALVDLMLNDVQ